MRNLASESQHRQTVAADNLDRIAAAHCERAKELEEAGRYAEAAVCLEQFWRGVGLRPEVEGLAAGAAAEVLVRAGSLTGWLGTLEQKAGAQEFAKDLIGEGASILEGLGETSKAAEARVLLAVCYWREGAIDEARAVLRDVLARNDGRDAEVEGRALLALAMVERRATRYDEALEILRRAAPLFEASTNDFLKGRFHSHLGTVLENLGRAQSRPDYIDRALVEYAAASFFAEQAGNNYFLAVIENNLGFLYHTLDRNEEAREHLVRSHQLFEEVGDRGWIRAISDTLARVLSAEGRYDEAERFARSAVRGVESGGEQSLLIEHMTTLGTVLARRGKFEEAETTLRRSVVLGEEAGALEGAGLAALTLIEEMGARLGADESRSLYLRADELLSRSQDSKAITRLRACAHALLTPREGAARDGGAPRPSAAAVEFVHASAESEEVLRRARLVAQADGAALLTGETGTGKETLARLIHEWSGRAGSFVTVHCAGADESAFGVRLFGRVVEDYTGSLGDGGAMRDAAGGTLYLDEVAPLSAANQVTLLRLLEWTESERGGATAGVRVIASTNEDLERHVAEGKFRGDLFYRLRHFHIELPPLRERAGDIPALAAHFLSEACRQHGKRVTFTPEALEAMGSLHLGGNARELRALIDRTVLTCDDGATVTAAMVETAAIRRRAPECLADPWANFSLKEEVHRIERRFIELALRDANGMVSHAARLLGFRHHESLASLLKNRHQELLSARTPARPRRRSIISRTDKN